MNFKGLANAKGMEALDAASGAAANNAAGAL